MRCLSACFFCCQLVMNNIVTTTIIIIIIITGFTHIITNYILYYYYIILYYYYIILYIILYYYYIILYIILYYYYIILYIIILLYYILLLSQDLLTLSLWICIKRRFRVSTDFLSIIWERRHFLSNTSESRLVSLLSRSTSPHPNTTACCHHEKVLYFMLTSRIVWFDSTRLSVCLTCHAWQIPDYRNAVIVAKNPNAVNRASSYAERLQLGFAVIHGEEKTAESEKDDGRASPPPSEGHTASRVTSVVSVYDLPGT